IARWLRTRLADTPKSSKIAAASKIASDDSRPPDQKYVSKNAAAPANIAMPVSGRLQPRSATRPAIGAAITPITPAKANSAIPFCDILNAGLANQSGEVVQNRLKAANISA